MRGASAEDILQPQTFTDPVVDQAHQSLGPHSLALESKACWPSWPAHTHPLHVCIPVTEAVGMKRILKDRLMFSNPYSATAHVTGSRLEGGTASPTSHCTQRCRLETCLHTHMDGSHSGYKTCMTAVFLSRPQRRTKAMGRHQGISIQCLRSLRSPSPDLNPQEQP